MVGEPMMPPSPIPTATYRLQLNRDFTFKQATGIVPYLADLGISHLYLSPCLKARPGSMHGYDIVDHNSFNPEIGTAEDFNLLVDALHERGMGIILDIVPNHMGIMGSDNAWWLDVLENGEASAYAGFFDIDWHPLKDELYGKVLVPALHDHYGAVLESGELKVVFHPERGEFDIWYRNHRFPLDPKEYPRILQRAGEALLERGEADAALPEFQSLITAFKNLPARYEVTPERVAERNRDKEIHKRRLAELCARSPKIAGVVINAVNRISGNAGDPASFESLHELIKAQAFRLASWTVASDDINYRRFFDINDLAGLRMENENVFEATHRFVLNLMAQRKIDGFRVDHPDGLYDPAQYFERLNRGIAAARGIPPDQLEPGLTERPPAYVVIEKILTGPEQLRSQWPVSGTTGYDFSNLVNGLFVDPVTAKLFDGIYHSFVDHEYDVDTLFYECRKLIIRVALASELNVLASQLSRIALSKRRTCDFTLNGLGDALTEVAASFPVYRTYVVPSGASPRDAEYIREAITSAKLRSPAADTSIFDFIFAVLTTQITEGQDVAYQSAVAAFAMKFQQFTSPVMAKGLEDTAFYRYNRLVSLNDVGGDLHRFGTTPAEFHAAGQRRCRDWPHTMLATSTHDSKRSEDVRVRIDVLSEMPGLWRFHLRDWRRFNRSYKRTVNGRPAPSPNDEYLLYQTLLGAWPSQPVVDEDDWKRLRERIEAYMLKALPEAKENTSWINRNQEYENAVSSFVRALVNPDGKNRFLADFIPFQQRIAELGVWSSLSQTVLKLTSPGVPDVYQGNELWNLSLVDPDNRRPVDYAFRRQTFDAMRSRWSDPKESVAEHFLRSPQDGRLKMYAIWRTLCLRRHHPGLFSQGEYTGLAVEGAKALNVIAFSRNAAAATAVVVVPRLVSGLLGNSAVAPIGAEVWKDTRVLLPNHDVPATLRNAFTGEGVPLQTVDGQIVLDVSTVLGKFPVALLLSS
jgi:(1->4)-alpha-D-glucan 1-alpha-D-glucosylmutase